jgi:hypothetical protein
MMTKLIMTTTLTSAILTMMHIGKVVVTMIDQTIGKNVQRENKGELTFLPTLFLFEPSNNSKARDAWTLN